LILDYGFWPSIGEMKQLLRFYKTIETDYPGFGNHYAIALKHIKDNLPDVKTIIDIGCAWGTQSYMFKDYNYIGLEGCPDKFFKIHPQHTFVIGWFPFVCPIGEVFISSMSLGYDFNIFNKRSPKEVGRKMIEQFKRFKYGFTKTEDWVEELILHAGFYSETINNQERIVFWQK